LHVLITGGSSQPGYKLILEAVKNDFEVTATYLNHDIPCDEPLVKKIKLDITNFDATSKLIKKERPNIVFHIAAYGDVDGCEENRHYAWKVNYLATLNIAKACRDTNAFLVYLSTDYVFDGTKGNYLEKDPAYPINFYGLTKLLGEIASISSSNNAAIVRASAIYGLGPGRKNFAKFLIEKLSNGEKIFAFTDQYLSPSNSVLLARAMLKIGKERMAGIFHVVGERMSRYEFAIRVAEKLGFDKNLIEKSSMDSISWKARRPRDSSLNYEYTRRRLNIDFYSTDLALQILYDEYVKHYKKV